MSEEEMFRCISGGSWLAALAMIVGIPSAFFMVLVLCYWLSKAAGWTP